MVSENKKAVEQRKESIENGEEPTAVTTRTNGVQAGLGLNDFRRRAYGRRMRVAVARAKKMGALGGAASAAALNALKTADQNKKERKSKRKAEWRNLSKEERNRRGKSHAKSSGGSGGARIAAAIMSSRSSKVRIIKRG